MSFSEISGNTMISNSINIPTAIAITDTFQTCNFANSFTGVEDIFNCERKDSKIVGQTQLFTQYPGPNNIVTQVPSDFSSSKNIITGSQKNASNAKANGGFNITMPNKRDFVNRKFNGALVYTKTDPITGLPVENGEEVYRETVNRILNTRVQEPPQQTNILGVWNDLDGAGPNGDVFLILDGNELPESTGITGVRLQLGAAGGGVILTLGISQATFNAAVVTDDGKPARLVRWDDAYTDPGGTWTAGEERSFELLMTSSSKSLPINKYTVSVFEISSACDFNGFAKANTINIIQTQCLATDVATGGTLTPESRKFVSSLTDNATNPNVLDVNPLTGGKHLTQTRIVVASQEDATDILVLPDSRKTAVPPGTTDYTAKIGSERLPCPSVNNVYGGAPTAACSQSFIVPVFQGNSINTNLARPIIANDRMNVTNFVAWNGIHPW